MNKYIYKYCTHNNRGGRGCRVLPNAFSGIFRAQNFGSFAKAFHASIPVPVLSAPIELRYNKTQNKYIHTNVWGF